MPPDLKFEDIINGILAFSKSLRPTYDKSFFDLDKSIHNFDISPVFNATLNDISFQRVENYFPTKGLRAKKKTDIVEHLKKSDLLHYSYKRKLLVPTAAGLLLFGKHPENFFVQSKIKADAFQGVEPINTIDQKDIKGTIFDMVKDTETFLLKNMKTAVRIEGFSRIQITEYPLSLIHI